MVYGIPQGCVDCGTGKLFDEIKEFSATENIFGASTPARAAIGYGQVAKALEGVR